MSANHDMKLSDMQMLTPKEQNMLINAAGETAEYPRQENIASLFEKQAMAAPDQIAAVIDDRQLSYRELDEKAERTAIIAVFKHQHSVKKRVAVHFSWGVKVLDELLKRIILVVNSLKCQCFDLFQICTDCFIPLFDAMLVLENSDDFKVELPELTLLSHKLPHHSSKFDLTLHAEEQDDGTISCHFEFHVVIGRHAAD